MKEGSDLKFGLIGCGSLGGSVHLPNLRRLPGLEVTAVADPDAALRDRALRTARQARVYPSGKALLEQEDLDAVVIASPPSTHAILAAKAQEQGVSVYLEKPLALDEAEGQQLTEAAQAGGARVMMGFNFRFSTVFEELREKLKQREAGEVLLVRSIFTIGPRGRGATNWRFKWEGDVLWELGSHHFDLISYLFNSPIVEFTSTGGTRPVSRARESEPGALNEAILNLRLESGVIVQSFLAYDAGLENRVEVFGSRGCLLADRFRSLHVGMISPRRRIWDFLDSIPAAAGALLQLPGFIQRLRSPWGDPSYSRALEHFIDSLRSGRRPRPDAEDGLRCLRMVEGAREAIRRTDTVSCPSS